MKALVLTCNHRSEWGSLEYLKTGILEVYKNIDEDIEFLDVDLEEISFDINFTGRYILNLIEFIKKKDTDKIVVFEPSYHFLTFLKFLFEFTEQKTEFIIYVYGSFVHYIKKWISLSIYLENRRIQFIPFSRAQASSIEKLVVLDGGGIEHIPCHILRCSSSSEFKTVKTPSRIKILFAGRISKQKNVLFAVKEIIENPDLMDIEIMIAGEFDNIDDTMLGFTRSEISLYDNFMGYFENLSSDKKKRIHFLGHLAPAELSQAFEHVDGFISLSTYHDECFNVSAAQAISYNLPCLLSSWGGHKDFITNFESVSHVDIKLKSDGFEFDSNQILNWLKELEPRKGSCEGIGSSYLCFERIKKLTQERLNLKGPTFLGFSEEALDLKKKDNFPLTFARSELYRSIYRSYYE